MPVNQLVDDIMLLQQIAKNDQRSFVLFYERYHQKIYTFCVRHLKVNERAEEVLQEVFLKIWLMGNDLLTIKNPEAYLRTIARNRCLDYIRALEREDRLYGKESHKILDSHNETEESILLADTRRLLDQGIEKLPPQQQKVYKLCHQQGLKYDEAATALQLSPLTVKNHMQAALKFLREHMNKNSNYAIAIFLLKIF